MIVDTYKTQQQGKSQTEKVKAAISTLEQTKQDLSAQEGSVNAATPDTWVNVRNGARASLEAAAQKLRDVE